MRASLFGKVLIPLVLAAACALLLLQKIDLTNVDLGRHLKNGDVLVHGGWAEKQAVLHTNFYSYAVPDFPFVNHHWLTGVVFYLMWRMAGFEGLTLLYVTLVSASVVVLYLTVWRSYGTQIAAPLVALAVPLIGWRSEVRPEAFTYLLIAVFFSLLLAWYEGRLRDRWLYVLPVLMLVWINLHIGFIFGFLIMGLFALKTWGPRARSVWPVAALSVVATLVNPNVLTGVLYPLNIFRNFGYSVAEDQSIARMAQRGMAGLWEYNLFYWLLATSVASFLLRWLLPKPAKAAPSKPSRGPTIGISAQETSSHEISSGIPEALLLGATAVLALSGVRNIQLFVLLMIPIIGGTLYFVLSAWKDHLNLGWLRTGSAIVFVFGLLCVAWEFQEEQVLFGMGLRDGVEATADFLSANRIAGPVFNDFDNGGYLIFHGQKVFVDGRPEAYPAEFMQKSYIGALSEDAVWRQMDAKYHFNAIVCSMEDAFPPIERFLIARAHDPEWAPVYTDFYSLVLVRRTAQNADTIRAHEIPQSVFRR